VLCDLELKTLQGADIAFDTEGQISVVAAAMLYYPVSRVPPFKLRCPYRQRRNLESHDYCWQSSFLSASTVLPPQKKKGGSPLFHFHLKRKRY
jgi:hypothetical protein